MISEPKFDKNTNTLTIPEVYGVEHKINGRLVTGEIKIVEKTVVIRSAILGFLLAKGLQTEFVFDVGQAEIKVQDVDNVKPADPVVVTTAGSTPENANQQASQANAGTRVPGFNR